MFTIRDIYYILNKENQKRIYYKNKTFYVYDDDEKLDYYYDKNFVYLSKLSYYLRKTFKNLDEDKLIKMFKILNFVEMCENFNNDNGLSLDYKSLINKKSFPIRNFNKIYKFFFNNEIINEIIFRIIRYRKYGF